MKIKISPFLFFLFSATLFSSIVTLGNNRNDDPKDRYNRVLHKTGILIREAHFSPRELNDAFSKDLLKQFIKELDQDKNILLQTDILSFNQYEKVLDNEINGADLVSFYTINDVYLKRMNEASDYFNSILDKPFDFSVKENVVMDPDKIDYPSNEAARYDMWRKRLKYQTLAKYAEYIDDRDKNKGKKDFVFKADSTLEREARDQVRKQMSRYFATRKNRETMDENFSTFINTITGMQDPHTNYFPPVDLRSFNESMSGRFYGIGAQLKDDDGHIKIVSVISGGPAWKNGELKDNDEIIKVGQGDLDPVDVTGFAISDAIKLIRGAEKGSVVKLTVKKMDGAIKVIAIERDEIKMDETFAKSAIVKQGDYKIGYIYLPEFYVDFQRADGARCSKDVEKEIEKLKAEKIDGIVIDLRGNGGGSLPEVVTMVGLFIEDGPVCQVKGRTENSSMWRDRDKTVQYDGPMAVMVDEMSASASEIFAAAIQDYKRGIIIGSTSTYGKGTVQRNIPLAGETYNAFGEAQDDDDMGSVKLTLQKFYRVNGGATQLKGVTPDVVIPDRLENLKFREKDNPFALSWDTIEKADYKPWTGTISNELVINNANGEVNSSATFNKIKFDVNWLEKYNDRDYPLNINAYRDEQNEVKRVYKEVDSLYKLTKSLDINNIPADTLVINQASDKVEKNKQWLKRVGEDVYVDQSIKIMGEMIKQNNMAKRN